MSNFDIELAAMAHGQIHQCQCGEIAKALSVRIAAHVSPVCGACGKHMWPMWDVRDSKGNVVGSVTGCNHQDALESAAQTPKYSALKAFTVTPMIIT
jgi:hypothetical protein